MLAFLALLLLAVELGPFQFLTCLTLGLPALFEFPLGLLDPLQLGMVTFLLPLTFVSPSLRR